MNHRPKGFYLVLVAAGLAALTAACASSSVQPPLGSPTKVDAVSFTSMRDLRVTSRADFVVCVDGAGGRVLSPSDVEHVKLELEAALATVADLPASLSDPIVTGECPPPRPGLVEGNLSRHDAQRSLTRVDTPGEHLLRVYFLPKAVYEAALGEDQPYLIASAETMCEADVCSPVTISIYLNETISSELMRRVFLGALSLQWIEPEGTPPEWQDLQACDRGETPQFFRCDQLDGYREDVERVLTPQPPDN